MGIGGATGSVQQERFFFVLSDGRCSNVSLVRVSECRSVVVVVIVVVIIIRRHTGSIIIVVVGR